MQPPQAIVKIVLPHDSGHAGVGQDVGIPRLLLAMPREGPVLLCAACKRTSPPLLLVRCRICTALDVRV